MINIKPYKHKEYSSKQSKYAMVIWHRFQQEFCWTLHQERVRQ